jgi:hypothetical protein
MWLNDLGELAPYGTPPAPHTAMNHRINHFSLPSSLRFALPGMVALIMSSGVAEAQRPVPAKPQTQQASPRREIVPPGFYPPAGMCRIWINGVPAAQQPAPTDCGSAVKNRPANGKVLFGDDAAKSKKGKSDKKKSSATGELVDLITRRIAR